MPEELDGLLNDGFFEIIIKNYSNRKEKKGLSNCVYSTEYGKYYEGCCEDVLQDIDLKAKVQLIITSPPFPLNKKKKYGNMQGDEYLKWISSLAVVFSELLTDDGSIVIEMGNAWEPQRPVQSLLTMQSLMAFVENDKAGLKLCQEFICHNPARLPSPAQWVTVNRIRAIDSFTHVWWMSKSDYPKADNNRILRPYSQRMKDLLKRGSYNSGKRPSEHVISKNSFLVDHEGSISHNVLELEKSEDYDVRFPYSMLRIANSNSRDDYLKKCRLKGIQPHPARMPLELASFFIDFLTDEGDIVLDPFAGSNTVGYVAEKLSRNWIAIDANKNYAIESKIRFEV